MSLRLDLLARNAVGVERDAATQGSRSRSVTRLTTSPGQLVPGEVPQLGATRVHADPPTGFRSGRRGPLHIRMSDQPLRIHPLPVQNGPLSERPVRVTPLPAERTHAIALFLV